jgi:hypothetical protein
MTIEEAKIYLTTEIKDKICELTPISRRGLDRALETNNTNSSSAKYIIQFALLEKAKTLTEVKKIYNTEK